MSIRSLILIPALACLLLGACSTTKSEAKPMNEAEMMEAMMKYGTPGEHHKALDPMAGSFRAKTKFRMDPNAEWQEDPTGTCENRWIFGNRFLESTFRGNFGGMPFEGRGYNGYDNSTGKYVNFWMDSMSTGLMAPSTGTTDKTGKVFTYECDYMCPITGMDTHMRNVVTVKSPNEHVMEMYTQQGDAPEYQSMVITFTRN